MDPLDWAPILKAMIIYGLFDAIAFACTSTCLLGISVNDIFSIIFFILLFFIAICFVIIAWKSNEDKFIRTCAIFGSVIMPVAGISCILVDEDFVIKKSSAAKAPLYMMIAVAIAIGFSIFLIQIINMLSCSNIKDRLLTNNNQITILLIINFVLGMILGLVFGLLKVEDREAPKSKMTIVTISFVFIGFLSGAAFAFYNEYETQKIQSMGLDPSNLNEKVTAYDEM